MPAGAMTRFIVISHDLINSDLYWKDGVVLTWEDSEAQIIKTGPRIIEVRINGQDKKTLLGMIRRHMDYIHSPFSNLEVDEMVPCLCHKCYGDTDPYFYPYQNLIEARKQGVKDIQCQISFTLISIEKLLGGIEDKTPEQRERRPQNIKVFLASSGELKEEREQIDLLVGKENRKLHYQNIFLDLVIWEDLKHSFSGKRIQDYFNEKMLECDIVICMFFKKVGNFTKEEFELAANNLKAGKNPRYLCVFFKSGKIDIDENDEEIQKIRELKKEIEAAEQLYNNFKSTEDLILQIKNQLDLIIPEIVY